MVASALCVSLAGAADNPTSEKVTSVLTNAKVLTKSFKVQCAGAQCTIVTYHDYRAAENDIKIDAILTAKAIMGVYHSIQSVTVQFYDPYNLRKYKFIEVHAGDVSAFGLGSLSKERLLSSLPVHTSVVADVTTKTLPEQQIDSPDHLLTTAKSKAEAADYQGALLNCNKVLDTVSDPRALFLRGAVYTKTGNYAAALADFSKVIEACPTNGKVYSSRAGVYLFMNEPSKALNDCNTALKLDSRDARAYDFRGAAHLHLGHSKEEIEADSEMALKLGSHEVDPFENRSLPGTL